MWGHTRCQSSRRTSGTVSGSNPAACTTGAFSPDGVLAHDGEIGMRQHGQRDVPVPARPGAHLVLVQSGLALGLLKAALDPPALARNPHQLGQRGSSGERVR